MRFQPRLKPCHNLIDLTPLVDVIFLMLIFFLVTSDVLPLKSLSIENPELQNVNSPAHLAQLLIVMDKDQVIYMGSKKDIIDMNSIKEHLMREIATIKELNPKCTPTVVLHVDRQVDYGAFLRLFSAVQECSPRIRLSYKPAII
ncbi:MAG: exbD [Chlamydiia bacterium]|nr:exbD [Chlamydiia bacterium]